jgi:glycosyltransferase involved in cell wall biosynthesis
MRKWIERFVKKRNSENKITLTRMIPRQEVQKFYEKADIFLYPSFEGGSIATLEAMAYGLPIICLNFGGPGQFVSKECGIKVEVGQFEKMVNHLSQAILRLAEDEQLRLEMGKNARNRVRNLYTWSKKAEDINKIYQEVLKNENSDNP